MLAILGVIFAFLGTAMIAASSHKPERRDKMLRGGAACVCIGAGFIGAFFPMV